MGGRHSLYCLSFLASMGIAHTHRDTHNGLFRLGQTLYTVGRESTLTKTTQSVELSIFRWQVENRDVAVLLITF